MRKQSREAAEELVPLEQDGPNIIGFSAMTDFVICESRRIGHETSIALRIVMSIVSVRVVSQTLISI
jgi:hypothetical protein